MNVPLCARLLLLAAQRVHRRRARAAAGAARIDAVHRAADAHVRAVASLFRQSWDAAQAAVSPRELQQAIDRKDVDAATGIVLAALGGAHRRLQTALVPRLQECLVSGGEAALRSVKARGTWYRPGPARARARRHAAAVSPIHRVTVDPAPSFRAAAIDLIFNAVHDRVLAWAETQSAQLVVEIDATTQAAIQEAISTAISEGYTAVEISRYIRNIVGLRSDQLQALMNYRESGASEAEVEQYGEELLAQRALLIARTETSFAAAAGQSELWAQAVEDGQLPADSQRVWIARGPNICVHCAFMDGQVVLLDEPFIDDDGEEYDDFPAHPGCVCVTGIARPEDVEAYAEYAEAA